MTNEEMNETTEEQSDSTIATSFAESMMEIYRRDARPLAQALMTDSEAQEALDDIDTEDADVEESAAWNAIFDVVDTESLHGNYARIVYLFCAIMFSDEANGLDEEALEDVITESIAYLWACDRMMSAEWMVDKMVNNIQHFFVLR